MTNREPRIGLYRVKDSEAVTVYWRDQEIARYESIAAFVSAHFEGVEVLQKQQEDFLIEQYRDV